MIFPQYDYKEFNKDNKNDWPLQPPTADNWCKMVNDSEKHCKSIDYIFEFDGLCEPTSLPSYHPYWKLEFFKNNLKLIENTRQSINATNEYIKTDQSYKMNAIISAGKEKRNLIGFLKKLQY
tara:strand:+ start:107 stop:472 length:366 start_codon:yes stop_codon:yes gene_type:complete